MALTLSECPQNPKDLIKSCSVLVNISQSALVCHISQFLWCK